MQTEVITNILVKSMTQFPSPQFSLALHLIPPASMAPGTELREAVAKLRALAGQLEGAQYAAFWAALDGDDLVADLIADIPGFEELVRERVVALVAQAYRELPLDVVAAWLGMAKDAEAAGKYLVEEHGWNVEDNGGGAAVVRVPRNADNEAKKTEVREDVNVDMFSRVIRRAWEEVA
jgi:translation initiation factor 3 subunit K